MSAPANAPGKRARQFCQINPLFYSISVKKEILKRHLKDARSGQRFARTFSSQPLPNLVYSESVHLIKRAPGIDLTTQQNKAVNTALAGGKINGIVIHPGEVFSFWRIVGSTTQRAGYRAGRVIRLNELVTGIGGGLCGLANTVHYLVVHSPLTITEMHQHSDALGPDEGGRVPLSAGTSVSYNYVDYRFENGTDQDVQLLVWCENETLHAELRSQRSFPCTYRVVEEDHHFSQEAGKYFRVSRIYREILDAATGEVLAKQLIRDNHSAVMYDHALIPEDQIRPVPAV